MQVAPQHNLSFPATHTGAPRERMGLPVVATETVLEDACDLGVSVRNVLLPGIAVAEGTDDVAQCQKPLDSRRQQTVQTAFRDELSRPAGRV